MSSSSQLFRISVPVGGAEEHQRLQNAWPGFQFWVWPYRWRKSGSNISVVNQAGRTRQDAPGPAVPAPEVPAPAAPANEVPKTPPQAPQPAADLEGVPGQGAGHLYEQPVTPVMGADEPPGQDPRGPRGSLVWKIPRVRGGHE